MIPRVLAAVASGVLIALAFPWPGLWPLAFVALAPLLIALEGVSARRGAALGAVTGVVSFAITLRWIAPLSVGGWIALAAYLAIYPAAFGAAATRLLRGRAWPRVAVPAAWVALEWVRGWAIGGFSWGALGYALAPAPVLAQAASLGGVALLSGAIVGAATSLAAAWPAVRARAWRRAGPPLAIATAIPALLAAHGAVALDGRGDAMRIAVVQADLSPRARWRPEVIATALTRYATITDQAAAAPLDLVVWPETAIPTTLDEGVGLEVRSRALRERVEQHWRAPLIFGVAEASPDPAKFYNAAVLYAPGGVRPASYRKRRLVPFGEYVPLPWLFGGLDRPLPGPDFVFGDGGPAFAIELRTADAALRVPAKPGLAIGIARIGVLICFEDVFADEAVARAEDADLLVVLTNDGWFGATGAAQHLAIAQLRAIETGRSIARAANTGISALIDPSGRVVARAADGPGFAVGALPRRSGVTVFARAPDAVPLAALALAVAALLTARASRTARSRPARPGARPPPPASAT